MANTKNFVPVILGGDIGVYALCRAFHGGYGVKPWVLAANATGPIAHSSILHLSLVKNASESDQYIQAALDIAPQLEAENPGAKLLLLANTDSLVRSIVERHSELETHYVLPFLPLPLLDQLSDKAEFATLCTQLDIPTPRTLIRNMANYSQPHWQGSSEDLGFPLIAKAARSSDFEGLNFPGKKKVYQIDSEPELAQLWLDLSAAGFKGRFILQEMITGDDTHMRSVTAYVDRNGQLTMLGGAQVLLEEHAPSALGNPAAMITGEDKTIFAYAKTLLEKTGYIGFANFDVKIDPRDGQPQFLEVNPRIGRNNFYMCAAGANPAHFVVEDRINSKNLELHTVRQEILYSILPQRLLQRYLTGEVLQKTQDLVRANRRVHPLRNPVEKSWHRKWYIFLAGINQYRKFNRYYPRPTHTGF